MSLVNDLLKFQMAILQIHCYFLLKKCNAKDALPSELHVKTCQRHVLTRNARNAEYWHMLLQVVT